jgi:NADH:ubiquinone oxidoreductase subunit F (NADH-binding)
LISAYAVGAHRCIVCLDKAQTSAFERLDQAVSQMKALGLLGGNILGTGFQAQIELKQVDGGLVKGERSALLRALQGRQPMPYLRTAHAALDGLDGHPTVINNVETLCHVKAILQQGATGFESLGTEGSKGTKVMTITQGDRMAMTIEVPFGTALRKIVETTDEMLGNRSALKAVQLGGPTGNFIAGDGLDTMIDFEAIAAVDGILGSGTIDLIREGACPVEAVRDIAGYLHDQSCGKCVFCREGTLQLADTLVKIADCKAELMDVEWIQELGRQMKTGCICSLGRTAVNPVLTSWALFPKEYDAHIKEKRCLNR